MFLWLVRSLLLACVVATFGGMVESLIIQQASLHQPLAASAPYLHPLHVRATPHFITDTQATRYILAQRAFMIGAPLFIVLAIVHQVLATLAARRRLGETATARA